VAADDINKVRIAKLTISDLKPIVFARLRIFEMKLVAKFDPDERAKRGCQGTGQTAIS